MTRTIATLCGGGEGVGVGAKAAGLTHLWSIEKDKRIAGVARLNGFRVYIGSVVAPWWRHGLPTPDVLHASPPCPEFSAAKAGGQEGWQDIAIAHGIARFIRIMRPRWFTLENVWKYRESQSWRIIADALAEGGYFFDAAHLNSADFSVPQTRKRMWVRAVRGGMVPHLPTPEAWVGWYAAIEDLIPDLPDTEFAPWQLERMPAELRETVLLAQGHYGDEPLLTRSADDPAYTVTANSNMGGLRALLVSNSGAQGRELEPRDDGKPANTVTAGAEGRWRALLVTGQYNKPNDCDDRGPQVRSGATPANTVTASNKGDWRGFIMSGGNADDPTVTPDDEPARTVVASHPALGARAFIIDGGNAGQDVPTIRDADEPTFTVIADSERAVARAAINGRVVRMTTRCLARFQSFPDDYALSGKKGLDARVIGNAVPPVQYEKIIGGLIR